MRPLSGLRPQDIAVLFQLVLWKDRPWKHKDLVNALGLSQTEISFSLERCRNSGLLDSAKKRVIKASFLEFLLHGLRYVYPAKPGPIERGVPTSHSAPPLAKRIVSDERDQYVWPHDEGTLRGQSISPLYPAAPDAAMRSPDLHQLLALADALRIGRARERKIAASELTTLLTKANV